MNTTYEYIDEESIDPEMICSICHSPFIDPRHTPCDETFCRECITNWIMTQNASCPLCRKSLSVDDLTQTTRMVRNMLDRLPVRCTVCGQVELQRGNFDDHIQKMCPKTIVSCSSADIKCQWTGQRDQLNQHLVECRFELMRPAIAQFVTEKQQLNDQVNRQITQLTEQQNEIKQLKTQVNQQNIQITGQQNEISQLEEQISHLRTQVNTCQRQIQQLNEQLEEKDSIITAMNCQSEDPRPTAPKSDPAYSNKKLDCNGRACANCSHYRDWHYSPGVVYGKNYKKRPDATCTGHNPYRDTQYGVTDYRHYLHGVDYGSIFNRDVGESLCECENNRL